MKRMLSLSLIVVAQFFMSQAALSSTVDTQAANFTLKSNSGKNLRLSEMRGEVVLINFWASWCGPCRQEMPELEAIYQKYQSLGFTILGINVDKDRAMADKVINKTTLSFPILFDSDNAVTELYKVDAMPTTVMVDRNGKVRFIHRGYKPGYEDEYVKQIKTLIRE
jgi:peroxiredoxin